MQARDHLRRNNLTDFPRRRGSGLDCALYGRNLAANNGSD
jgi:hypothetical protein